uniref:Uncharacterized protein n=1 Tax=Populus davidiana TaxID=266767 RepID=A0A6M2F0U3_9ROSI
MSCSFLLIPSKFSTLNSYSEHINSSALLGFSSFSCLRNRRRSNSIATSISRGRSPGCKCQLADIAPVTSAAYGVILLGGGLFAFSKSGSKGSLFGGLTGVALMGTVSSASILLSLLYLVNVWCELFDTSGVSLEYSLATVPMPYWQACHLLDCLIVCILNFKRVFVGFKIPYDSFVHLKAQR